jgi:hypothetical protein
VLLLEEGKHNHSAVGSASVLFHRSLDGEARVPEALLDKLFTEGLGGVLRDVDFEFDEAALAFPGPTLVPHGRLGELWWDPGPCVVAVRCHLALSNTVSVRGVGWRSGTLSPFLKCETQATELLFGFRVSDSRGVTIKVNPSPMRSFFFAGSTAAAI